MDKTIDASVPFENQQPSTGCRMNGPNNVRVVLGVRSSAHYPVPATEPGGQWDGGRWIDWR